ncbi:5-(carboxyamino)imidazole ribonucleotide mutase [Candidatus Albibeggiatoa sp. nov. BB20]|uniref:5-(carboxyamino)imidazole ribonucleotide mutase n=1 Tax=Candidatus Albibeggiatoa sp. nov. BB20 TaxID=3162723 RepID=UPI003365431F
MLNKAVVGIIMGSDSDLPVMQDAAKILDELHVSYELSIVSAHRTPQRLFDYAQQAEQRGLEVVIAGAGGAAHLPGMIAAVTPLPVVGVPIKTSSLNGLDSLLSIVQMPGGVPVASVAINNAKNAGLLAAQIISGQYPEVRQAVKEYKQNLEKTVLDKAQRLEQQGYQAYLGS